VGLLGNIPDDFLHRLFHAVVLLNGNVDFSFGTEGGLDPHAGSKGKGLNRFRILRFGHGHMKDPWLFLQRQHPISLGNRIGHHRERVRVPCSIGNLYDVQTKLFG